MRCRSFAPRLEALEDRSLLSTTLLDSRFSTAAVNHALGTLLDGSQVQFPHYLQQTGPHSGPLKPFPAQVNHVLGNWLASESLTALNSNWHTQTFNGGPPSS